MHLCKHWSEQASRQSLHHRGELRVGLEIHPSPTPHAIHEQQLSSVALRLTLLTSAFSGPFVRLLECPILFSLMVNGKRGIVTRRTFVTGVMGFSTELSCSSCSPPSATLHNPAQPSTTLRNPPQLPSALPSRTLHNSHVPFTAASGPTTSGASLLTFLHSHAQPPTTLHSRAKLMFSNEQ